MFMIKRGKVQSKLKYIIDVGSSKIALFACATYAGITKIIAEEDVLYDGYMDGEFLSPEVLETVLSNMLDGMFVKMRKPIRSVTVGVPAEFCKVACKRISRQFISSKKITNSDLLDLFENNKSFGDSEEFSVINYSAMQYVLDDSVKTHNPVGKRTAQLTMDASFVLAKNSFIKTFKTLLTTYGVQDIEFISTALGQAFECGKRLEITKPFAVVDVGHISTSVCVFKGEGIALLSSFTMGGGHISSDIMQVLGMSFKEAELIKRKVILTVESNKNEYYQVCSHGSLIKAPINITNQIVRSRIELIAKAIGRVLEVDDIFTDIDVYITGDGIANFKGVKSVIKGITGFNTYKYQNPLDNSKGKYQTSKTGLASLAKIIV